MLAERGARLVALGVEPPPEADERGSSRHSAPTVECPTWPGFRMTAGSSAISLSMIDVRRSSNEVEPGRVHAADRAREERVAGEALLAVHDEREHARAVARGVDHVDAQPAALDDVAIGERRVDAADRVGLERVREHRHLVAAAVLVEVRDVVARGGASAARAWAAAGSARSSR